MIDILYEDNHIIAVVKPAGILTQPSGTQQDSMQERVRNWIKTKYQKPGNVFLEAIHRLDKPASGVVLFGKTSKAVSRLNAAIREKKVRKGYYALVENPPKEKQATLENYLIHDEFKAEIVNSSHPEGKIARLSYEVLSCNDNICLLKIDLDTGRYHQIRLQLSTIGSPVLGDSKYGSKISFEEGIALHHYLLEFPHPVKDELVLLQTPLPASFKKYVVD